MSLFDVALPFAGYLYAWAGIFVALLVQTRWPLGLSARVWDWFWVQCLVALLWPLAAPLLVVSHFVERRRRSWAQDEWWL